MGDKWFNSISNCVGNNLSASLEMNSSNIYHLREQNPTNKVKVTRIADYVVAEILVRRWKKKKLHTYGVIVLAIVE